MPIQVRERTKWSTNWGEYSYKDHMFVEESKSLKLPLFLTQIYSTYKIAVRTTSKLSTNSDSGSASNTTTHFGYFVVARSRSGGH